MGALTTAEIVAIVVALIEHAPDFVKFVQSLQAQGLPLLQIPPEHRAAVTAAVQAIHAQEPNPVIQAIADQMR